jgi:H+/Na+-translocating ferredoxin:NAD+ oxidoreductase subunit G
MLKQQMSRSALLLGLFALIGTGVVALIFSGTETRIADAERAYMLRSLDAVIDSSLYDNDIFNDMTNVSHRELLGTDDPVAVFRARKNGQPVAIAITPVAPQGYVGPIKLMIGISAEGTVLGVRVLSHRETPGLGDGIEAKRSDWVFSFNGRSLDNPDSKGWRVRRDGGQFDQFTGATITPRTIVKTVHNALKFFNMHKDKLFQEAAMTAPHARVDAPAQTTKTH